MTMLRDITFESSGPCCHFEPLLWEWWEAIRLSSLGALVHLQSGIPSFTIFFLLKVAFSFDLKAVSIKALPASVRVKMWLSSSSLERGSSSESSPCLDLSRFMGRSLPPTALSVCDRVANGSCQLEAPVAPLFKAATST